MKKNKLKNSIDKLHREMKGKNENYLQLRLNSEISPTGIYLYVDKFKNCWLGFFNKQEPFSLIQKPLIDGIMIEDVKQNEKIGTFIKKTSNYDEEIYLEFVSHIVEELYELNSPKTISAKLLRLLISWKIFFANGTHPLTEEKQIGLIGELIVFQKIVLRKLSFQSAIDSWVGPKRGLHDFVFKHSEFEVKTTGDRQHSSFKISSEDQLSDIENKTLFLINPVFEKNDQEKCLSYYIDSIEDSTRIKTSEFDNFMELLNHAGYHKIHHEYYKELGVKMQLKDIVTYLVNDKFPRISTGNLGPNIRVGNYKVSKIGCTKSITFEDLECK